VNNSSPLLSEAAERIRRLAPVPKVPTQVSSIKIANTHVKTEMLKAAKISVTMIFILLPASSGQIQNILLPKDITNHHVLHVIILNEMMAKLMVTITAMMPKLKMEHLFH